MNRKQFLTLNIQKHSWGPEVAGKMQHMLWCPVSTSPLVLTAPAYASVSYWTHLQFSNSLFTALHRWELIGIKCARSSPQPMMGGNWIHLLLPVWLNCTGSQHSPAGYSSVAPGKLLIKHLALTSSASLSSLTHFPTSTSWNHFPQNDLLSNAWLGVCFWRNYPTQAVNSQFWGTGGEH